MEFTLSLCKLSENIVQNVYNITYIASDRILDWFPKELDAPWGIGISQCKEGRARVHLRGRGLQSWEMVWEYWKCLSFKALYLNNMLRFLANNKIKKYCTFVKDILYGELWNFLYQLYFIHVDHINHVCLCLNATGSEAWSAYMSSCQRQT